MFHGVANLRNLDAGSGVPEFNEWTLDALTEDSRSATFGFSHYVLCVDHRPARRPGNLITGDSASVTAALRAATGLRLAASGNVTFGPMWFTRAARFNVGVGEGVGRTGWPVPASIGATRDVCQVPVPGRHLGSGC